MNDKPTIHLAATTREVNACDREQQVGAVRRNMCHQPMRLRFVRDFHRWAQPPERCFNPAAPWRSRQRFTSRSNGKKHRRRRSEQKGPQFRHLSPPHGLLVAFVRLADFTGKSQLQTNGPQGSLPAAHAPTKSGKHVRGSDHLYLPSRQLLMQRAERTIAMSASVTGAASAS